MIDSRNIFTSGGAFKATRQVISSQSTSPCAATSVADLASLIGLGFSSALSGAMTAGVPKPMLSISGSAGEMPYLQVGTIDATSRTVRLRVTVDGQTSPYAFDSITGPITTASLGIMAAGNRSSTVISPWSTPIRWTNSLVIEIYSSLTETDKLYVGYRYNLEQ